MRISPRCFDSILHLSLRIYSHSQTGPTSLPDARNRIFQNHKYYPTQRTTYTNPLSNPSSNHKSEHILPSTPPEPKNTHANPSPPHPRSYNLNPIHSPLPSPPKTTPTPTTTTTTASTTPYHHTLNPPPRNPAPKPVTLPQHSSLLSISISTSTSRPHLRLLFKSSPRHSLHPTKNLIPIPYQHPHPQRNSPPCIFPLDNPPQRIQHAARPHTNRLPLIRQPHNSGG
jgi:hypothetical protein